MSDLDRDIDELRKGIGLGQVKYCLAVAWALVALGDDKNADAWLDKADENARQYGVAWEEEK